MTKTKAAFVWTDECQDAHDLLKEVFAEQLRLLLPSEEGIFKLHTDVSSYAAAAVLSQTHEFLEDMPIAFYSKTFYQCQLRSHILDKELYAMVDAMKHFKFYLCDQILQVYSDSKVLPYLREARDTNPKLIRWSLIF